MEKALKLLKEIHPSVGIICIPSKEEIKEAIAELEEAMKPKTCSSCYWWNDFYTQCNDHDNALAGVNDYCCNRYEPKDTQ